MLLQLYNTLVLPYLNYCNMIWTAASETLLNKLQVLQKKAVRIINKSARLAHADPVFNKFQLLKLEQFRHFQILGFMCKVTHGLLPTGFKDYFCTQSDIDTYNTRTASQSALGISFARTNRRKKSLKIIVSYLWDDLPLNIRQSQSLASFKYNLKHYLLQHN